jgi:hypothetical protein
MGLVFDLSEGGKNLNPGVWFDLKDGARVCVRTCAGDDLRNIEVKTVMKKTEYRGGQRYEYEQIDHDLRNELLWDFVIVDWSGIIGVDGEDIACTKQNKIMLMGKSIRFAGYVAECLDKLAVDRELLERESEKN